jgi:glycerol-3-phosphate O-acyltransferase / dihydroxyacetone phosphate acyltransferase
MNEPFLYRISRFFVHIGVHGYFRKLEISGRDHIPSTGPVIFASNHPHSITDALLLGLGAGRMLHFIAHSGLFRHGLQSWFLRASGVIPVFRPKDVTGAADKNTMMFAACHDVLHKGGSIGIFPEGTSAEERRVQKLKTGTVRIALSAEAAADWKLGVTIVPVGLNFESRSRFRSRVLVRFGKPIRAVDWRDQYEDDPVSAVETMTDVLREALRRRVVEVERTEFDDLLSDVNKIYKSELMSRADMDIPGETPFKKGQTLTREFGRALDYFYERSPEVIWGLTQQMSAYNIARRDLRLRDELIREQEGPSMRAEMVRFLVMGGLGFIPALFGILTNGLPYKLTEWLAKTLTPDKTKIHSYQFVVGLLMFVGWYALVLSRAYDMIGGWGTLVLGVLMPPAGLYARQYVTRMRKHRRMLRFAWLEFLLGYKVREIRIMRLRLIRDLDAALDEYMRSLEEKS